MDIEIGLAGPDDLPRLREVIRKARLHTRGLEDCRWLVKGAVDGKTVGAAGVEVMGPHAFFRSFAVDKSMRGQGVGSLILRRSLEICQENDIRNVYLVTAFSNVHRFEHYGFNRIKRQQMPTEIKAHWQVASLEFKLLAPVLRSMHISLD